MTREQAYEGIKRLFKLEAQRLTASYLGVEAVKAAVAGPVAGFKEKFGSLSAEERRELTNLMGVDVFQ
jgi:hypothetical protein